jgi:predicted DNA-binding transcriptional regulator AlpA
MHSSPNDDFPNGERLLSKAEVCARVGKSFPCIWQWMQSDRFPRARDNHGRPAWLESEISEWIRNLPVKPYRCDDNATVVNAHPIRAAKVSALPSNRRKAAKTRRANVRARKNSRSREATR